MNYAEYNRHTGHLKIKRECITVKDKENNTIKTDFANNEKSKIFSKHGPTKIIHQKNILLKALTLRLNNSEKLLTSEKKNYNK